MAEKYGVSAQLVKSIARTPVDTSTQVIFIGASKSGTLNEAVEVFSFKDYSEKLGGEAGDGFNLTEAAHIAFEIANLDSVWMIPVANSSVFSADDYIGAEAQETGVYAVQRLLREHPTAVNILCCPSVTDSTVITPLIANAKKAAGHWDSMVYFDNDLADDAVTGDVVTDVSAFGEGFTLRDEQAVACVGRVKDNAENWLSLAAVRACLQAKADAENHNIPARSGGNLPIPMIVGWGDGTDILQLPEGTATTLSSNGICSVINLGGGMYRTWGDHTSAYREGGECDERARFDCTMRMLLMITNRFQLKYRSEIDEKMTLQMRNDIINEQLDYLNGLVGSGDILGEPIVAFDKKINTEDNLQQGQFTWSIQCTPTLPLKYAQVDVAYSTAGLSVYTAE